MDEQSLWAVGGDPADEDRGGAVWKWNGTEWLADTQAEEARPGGLPTLYKVWGSSPTDVYAVGRLGTILHYNGVRWAHIPTGVVRPLFTIHGDPQRLMAVGGAFDGVILELEGSSFIDRAPAGSPQMNGIFVAGSGGPATAVGDGGVHAVRGPAGWELKPAVVTKQPFDFHAVWVDSAGGAWAVGGDLRDDLDYGVVAYGGSAGVSPEFAAEACATGITSQLGTVSYTNDIVPLFRRAGCLNTKCHGPQPESELDLRTYEGLFGPGVEARNHGMCNVVPGNPDASYLLEKLLPDPRSGDQMPSGLPALTQDQIALVSTWILEGARRDVAISFFRGEVNDDGQFNLTDPITVLSHLFLSGPAPGCLDAADVNDDGVLNLTDGIYALNHLFLGGPEPAAPFAGCGSDPTRDDDLGCQAFGECQ
jgi:hypothetical protein